METGTYWLFSFFSRTVKLLDAKTKKIVETIRMDLIAMNNLLIYKEKAINLLKKVLASNDLPSREKARVALFNIANNRTCYSSKNGQEHDW